MTVPAFYDKFRIKSRCKTPLSFKLWFPAANLKNICRSRCSHRPTGTHLPPNIPPQPSHHLKSQGRAFLHSPDFNLSSLWQHRTIPALRLKHRSGSCGTASALPKCSIMSGCGTRIVLRGQKPLALCDRCPCFGSLFPPLAALTFAASSIICAFGLASAAPRSPYRHLELCGVALIILYTLYFGAINAPVRLSNQYRMPSIITTPFAIAPVMGSK